jgi:hypothetical protein
MFHGAWLGSPKPSRLFAFASLFSFSPSVVPDPSFRVAKGQADVAGGGSLWAHTNTACW